MIMQRWLQIVMATSALILIPMAVAAADDTRDCDNNAVVYCGAYSPSELTFKIDNGDGHNDTANLKQIFYHENHGITAESIARAVDGTVKRDGHVMVGTNVVADNVSIEGRDTVAGATKDGSLFPRTTSAAFSADSAPALVNTDGGVFRWAVLKSGGNIVKAQTSAPSATPTPSPTPDATPTATPTTVPTTGGTGTDGPLPSAGAEAPVAGAALGLGALSYSIRAWVRSRRNLLSSLRRK